jgi:hypothetical protein
MTEEVKEEIRPDEPKEEKPKDPGEVMLKAVLGEKGILIRRDGGGIFVQESKEMDLIEIMGMLIFAETKYRQKIERAWEQVNRPKEDKAENEQ